MRFSSRELPLPRLSGKPWLLSGVERPRQALGVEVGVGLSVAY
jgi:hypothetical protein